MTVDAGAATRSELESFAGLSAEPRAARLRDAIGRSHRQHVERNGAYRRLLEARGVRTGSGDVPLVTHPFMAWAATRLATPRLVEATRTALRTLAGEGRPLMLLGGLVQLHAVASRGAMGLPAGSRIATGGGMKEAYGCPPEQIRADLEGTFAGSPVRDVYGMAEANWAAFECDAGHHHLPPWVYAVVTDDDDRIVGGPDAEGLLAFFDPIGGSDLWPPFFQTADHVRLVNGGDDHDPALVCPCGQDTPYRAGRIARVDLMEEAGCAAQV